VSNNHKLLEAKGESLSVWILAFITSFVLNLTNGFSTVRLTDAIDYIKQAEEIQYGLDYIYQNPEDFSHNLPFSFLIHVTFEIIGSNSLILFKILLIFTFSYSALLFNKILKVLELDIRFRVAMSCLFIFNPFLLVSTIDVQTECFVTLIVLQWLLLYLRVKEAESIKNGIVYGIFILGLFAIILRPNMFLVFLVVLVIFYKGNSWNKLKQSASLISISVFTLIFTAYELFLTKLNGGFVFLANYGGIGAAYTCNSEFVPQYLGFASENRNNQINDWFNSVSNTDAQNQFFSLSEINSKMYGTGISKCLEDPMKSFFVLIAKTYSIWRPHTVVGAYGISVALISFLLWAPCLYFTYSFLKRKQKSVLEKRLSTYFIAISLSFMPSLLITINQVRHRVSFAEPFFLIFLGIGISKLMKLSKKNVSN
jgi:hypothetical protein